jgi:2,4-dienoyl-CoA reductase-like NADH-dependent reductase (Old Yellow Enzyme family)
MTEADIDDAIGDFVTATRRARAAGIDVVELHFGHGYLIASFLSPAANQRSDAYGGSRENRMRQTVQVATAVRQGTKSLRDSPLRRGLSR